MSNVGYVTKQSKWMWYAHTCAHTETHAQTLPITEYDEYTNQP